MYILSLLYSCRSFILRINFVIVIVTNYTISNYNMELDNKDNNRGGGVCLYIHTSAKHKVRNDLKLTQKYNSKHSKEKKSSHKEVNSIFIEIQKGSSRTKHNIIVGCIYRPPCYPLAEFNELLSDMLNNIQRENKHIDGNASKPPKSKSRIV